MEYEAKRKKEAGHAQRNRNHRRSDRGGPGITEFYDPWEEKLPKEMFPAAIRSILVAVSRVVRDGIRNFRNLWLQRMHRPDTPRDPGWGSASVGAKSYRPYISRAALYARSNTAIVTI
ncbi:hypothetical protein [Rhizobium ruizarguesonis]|uniref:hypothetical protein n=1 Tax=Rhizobium ruizarguesonis TaxID=2081791 RepID=UPI001FEDB776|nr:hypothetical protein [Rhizobium ruizarguesonis]